MSGYMRGDEDNSSMDGFTTGREQELEEEWNRVSEEELMDSDMDEKSKLLVSSGGHSKVSPDLNRRIHATTYEDALLACGRGRFHMLVLLLCGWAVSSDAIEVLSVSFLLPSATCDLHMSSSEKGLVNSCLFIGMLIGGYSWGALADRQGRRNILVWSLLVNGLGNLASSVAQVYWLFMVFRFISGLGVGGSMPVVFTYFTEFQHKSRRGAMISLLATFWMSGNIVAAGLAWIIIPRTYLSFVTSDFTFNSWRVFTALCTVPSLSSALLFVLMPESPKFLLQAGREQDAITVLNQVHRVNRSRTEMKLDMLVLGDKDVENDEPSDAVVPQPTGRSRCEKIQLSISKVITQTLNLFSKRLRRVTILLLLINFTLAFGYYGLFMWFPELFNRIDKYGGSFCDVKTGNATYNDTVCEEPGEDVYFNGFLTSLSNLPGNIFTIFLVERIGRKALLASSMVLSGVSVFLLLVMKTQWQNVLMSCIFGAISVCGFNMLDVLQTELFPTNVRSTAFGVQTAAARVGAILGNVAFGELVDVYCIVPLLLVASLLSFGGFTSLALPNTTGVDIH